MSTFTKLSPSNTVLYKHTASSLQDNWLQVPGRYSPLLLEPGFYTPYLQDLQLRFMDRSVGLDMFLGDAQAAGLWTTLWEVAEHPHTLQSTQIQGTVCVCWSARCLECVRRISAAWCNRVGCVCAGMRTDEERTTLFTAHCDLSGSTLGVMHALFIKSFCIYNIILQMRKARLGDVT